MDENDIIVPSSDSKDLKAQHHSPQVPLVKAMAHCEGDEAVFVANTERIPEIQKSRL